MKFSPSASNSEISRVVAVLAGTSDTGLRLPGNRSTSQVDAGLDRSGTFKFAAAARAAILLPNGQVLCRGTSLARAICIVPPLTARLRGGRRLAAASLAAVNFSGAGRGGPPAFLPLVGEVLVDPVA